MARETAWSSKQIKGNPPLDRSVFARPPKNLTERRAANGQQHRYMYVFGPLGGPFKIGYSIDPMTRAGQIMFDHPGRFFVGEHKLGMMWLTMRVANAETARAIERVAHKGLKAHSIRAPSSLIESRGWKMPGRSEWFDITLVQAITATVEAVSSVVGRG